LVGSDGGCGLGAARRTAMLTRRSSSAKSPPSYGWSGSPSCAASPPATCGGVCPSSLRQSAGRRTRSNTRGGQPNAGIENKTEPTGRGAHATRLRRAGAACSAVYRAPGAHLGLRAQPPAAPARCCGFLQRRRRGAARAAASRPHGGLRRRAAGWQRPPRCRATRPRHPHPARGPRMTPRAADAAGTRGRAAGRAPRLRGRHERGGGGVVQRGLVFLVPGVWWGAGVEQQRCARARRGERRVVQRQSPATVCIQWVCPAREQRCAHFRVPHGGGEVQRRLRTRR
jgi:hypothetical protein